MKILKKALYIFPIVLFVFSILICWADVRANVPMRIGEALDRVEIFAKDVFNHFLETITEDIQEVKDLYGRVVPKRN